MLLLSPERDGAAPVVARTSRVLFHLTHLQR